jgi:hypothetical protein
MILNCNVGAIVPLVRERMCRWERRRSIEVSPRKEILIRLRSSFVALLRERDARAHIGR